MKYKTREDKVNEFHTAMGLDVDSEARVSLLGLRDRLIKEEAREVSEAFNILQMTITRGKKPTRTEWANLLKELADLQYVLSGTIVALHALDDFDAAFNRVHRSNMTKLGDDGKPVKDDGGKVVKGPNYKPPYLTDLIKGALDE